jgi:hypothetical protein
MSPSISGLASERRSKLNPWKRNHDGWQKSEEEKRKLQEKRFNEHVKLLVTTINASGLVIFAAGVLQPMWQPEQGSPWGSQLAGCGSLSAL